MQELKTEAAHLPPLLCTAHFDDAFGMDCPAGVTLACWTQKNRSGSFLPCEIARESNFLDSSVLMPMDALCLTLIWGRAPLIYLLIYFKNISRLSLSPDQEITEAAYNPQYETI